MDDNRDVQLIRVSARTQAQIRKESGKRKREMAEDLERHHGIPRPDRHRSGTSPARSGRVDCCGFEGRGNGGKLNE